jgi:Cof subfamily protein (haloacid dehalogenase superfamily)
VTIISLVAVDLDGTLLTSERLLAPRGAKRIKQAYQSGVHVVLSTTRNPGSVQAFCRQLDIHDPAICTNGAQVWGSPDGPVWSYRCLRQEIALAIAQRADTHGWELSTTVGSITYWRQRPGQVLGPISPHRAIVAANSDAIVGDPVRILVSQPQAIGQMRSFCQSTFSNECHTEIYYNLDGTLRSLGIYAPGADKGTALALVLDRLGVKKDQALAIGDNPGDAAMFRHAGIGIAMGNAIDKVKRQASAIAPSNDDEGVAWALETFVLEGEGGEAR